MPVAIQHRRAASTRREGTWSDSTTELFTLQVVSNTIEASNGVRVAADAPGSSPDPAAPGVLRWSGAVPPQKWRISYPTIVSRFTYTPGLNLTVGLEVPVALDHTKSKTDETKTALRELGLSDDVL